jgi:uncharacterized protein YlxP (DUF503 family)
VKCCVGVMTCTLHLPHSHSLKDRRSAINSIKERARSKCNVSVSEEAGETWQIANMAFACVADSERSVEAQFRLIRELIEQDERVLMFDPRVEYYV